jgi:hypothetical protein
VNNRTLRRRKQQEEEPQVLTITRGAFRRAIPSGYLVYTITLSGITPLLMSSGEVDRDGDLYQAYETLASTRKKTREQKAQLRELEWHTRIYFDDKLGPYIPGKNVKELLRESATKYRMGESLKRGLIVPEYRLPLIYEGPRDLKGLWNKGFRYTTMVANAGAGSGRVDRTRPCFPDWQLVFDVAFDQEELDQHVFENVVARSEKYGLGDYKPEFGAFRAHCEFQRIENADLRVNGAKDRDATMEAVTKARAKQVMTVA